MNKTLCALLVCWSALALADESAVKLRPGNNQDVVARNCAVCHSLDYIQMNSRFLDRKGWEATVTKMVKVMGAPIKEEDVPLILDYLDQQYGKPK
ncbi:sulfide dehydrogenase [Pseudogulbenkiania subflava]|uniref:Sulfite dehydrogenase (Cytochrome) subunit SorB n=1 Tax=Pseudogulbenkiania subflava DSM 22618 TaxID=1123014 RepID=A0A1Y6BBV9_9NEIS|nr:sulfide dehydrogenase [Pseudogulbenkiania subflava]SME94941.1 sulfite dehydrogenase (cytochrome) subunit SorB [Pseudogulbenkiania subflava DSM 22618]